MQHVKATWLRNYNFVLFFLDAVILSLFLWVHFFNGPQSITTTLGINQLIAVIVGIHITFGLTAYLWFYKRLTWITNVVSLAIWGYLFVTIIDTSGHTFLPYRIGLIGYVFLLALDGPFAPIAAVFLIWVVLLLAITDALAGGSAPLLFNITIDTLATLAGVLGWYIFRRFYVNQKTEQETQLANLLKQEQFKSSTIIESITDGVMIVNQKGTIQLLNQSAAEMLGWNQSEALHLDYRSIVKAVGEDDQQTDVKTAIDLSRESGKSAQAVTKLETHNQHQMYVDIVASPINQTTRQKDGTEQQSVVGTIAVLRDVDKQKRTEQQRSDFISTASHEMRTPVASIQGYIELALNPKVATIDPKAKGYLEKAHEATEHLGNLFQDLLTVSKSEDGHLANHPALVELNSFVKETIEQDAAAAEEKHLKVTVESSKPNEKTVAPLLYVFVDPDRLREVVLNLFENAIKYTPAGTITVGCSLKQNNAIFRVSDTGLGIAEEDIPHLFQKFYRTDNSKTREIGGTGLGLYICKEIVEMMGGKIYVESTVGAGSTFFVEIPRATDQQIAEGEAKPEEPQQPQATQTAPRA